MLVPISFQVIVEHVQLLYCLHHIFVLISRSSSCWICPTSALPGATDEYWLFVYGDEPTLLLAPLRQADPGQ
jgi:hypothetical protein